MLENWRDDCTLDSVTYCIVPPVGTLHALWFLGSWWISLGCSRPISPSPNCCVFKSRAPCIQVPSHGNTPTRTALLHNSLFWLLLWILFRLLRVCTYPFLVLLFTFFLLKEIFSSSDDVSLPGEKWGDVTRRLINFVRL